MFTDGKAIFRCLGRRFCRLVATLHILGPIAYILLWVENQVGRTWHMMFAFTFAHVVVSAVIPILVVAYVAIFLFAGHIVCYNTRKYISNTHT